MHEIKKELELFDKLLEEYFNPLYQRLQPPLSEEMIDYYLQDFDIEEPAVKEIFMWRNGIANEGEFSTLSYRFCQWGVIPPLEYIKEIRDYYMEEELMSGTLIPIVVDFGGNFLLLDVDKDSPTNNMLLLRCPTMGYVEDTPPYFDSIFTMLKTFNACIQEGGYRYNEREMALDIDVDIIFDISARLNPKASFWDDYRIPKKGE